MLRVPARLLGRSADIRPGEGPALLCAGAYYFLLLCAYYILRPIRDDMGAAGGVENLAWLFSAVLVGMLALQPLYGQLVSRLPRRRFIPLVYRFFISNLLIFYVLFQFVEGSSEIWAGRIFFVWTSIFNLFVVSVFWSFINDIFRPSQSRRLFGIVAVGGTAGALSGSIITSSLASVFGPVTLLLVSAVILEAAARVSLWLGSTEEQLAVAAARDEAQASSAKSAEPDPGTSQRIGQEAAAREHEVIGGGALDGIVHVMRSPYLLAIALLMLMFTIVSTFLYFQQIAIVNEVFGADRAGRTQLFANRDLVTNALTLICQIFFTGRILKWFGVGIALAFLPVVSFIGFGLLAAAPVLMVVIAFDVIRRTSNFAVQRPAREALYTVLSRNDKYKAKNFNDTFVYRVGDQAGAWSYNLIAALGFSMSALALTMLPVSLVWFFLALWLGRRYRRFETS